MESNQFFATAKPVNLFIRVAIPGLISMLAMSLYQAFEGGFVGQLLGESAFAAINIGFPIVLIGSALADMVGVGSSAPISVALGRQDGNRANNIFSCSVVLIFLQSIVMGVIFFFASPFIVDLLGAKGELATLAVKYVRVYAIMGPVANIVFAMDNYLRISGYVKGSMILNVFMSALTVGFLALFLIVFKMDVEGSALAACLAFMICAAIAFIPFIRKRAVLQFTKPRFSLPMLREIIACGFPVFLNNMAGRITALFLNAALLRAGGQTAVAAYSVMMYASAVVEPMLYGMCDSVQPSIGYNWGAGSLKRVASITKVTFTVCGLVSVLCAAVMFFLPRPIASIFVNAAREPELMEMAVQAMPYAGLAFLLGWFCFAVQGFFAAIEKPMYATIVSFSYAVIFPMGLIYALQPLGLTGLWLNYFGKASLTAIVAIALILKAQRHMKTDILKHLPR